MRGRLIVALIVLLVVLDVVLVTLAVRRGHAGPVVAAHRATNSTPTSTPTSTPARSATPHAAAGRMLVSGAGDVVLRATGGSCKTGQPPVMELSSDSGATFAPTAEGLGVAQVLRVAVDSASNVWFVGADDQCATSIWRLDPAGSDWYQSAGTAGAWHVLPTPGVHRVHAPTGRVAVNCAVTGLAPVDTQTARVLCASGVVRGTSDGGVTWTNLGRLRSAQLIAYDSATSGAAIGSAPTCGMRVLITDDGGATWTPATCLQGADAQALAFHAGHLIAIVDDSILISSDGGHTWSAP